MLQLFGCDVHTDDHIHDDMTDAKVTILGESGGAVIKVSEPDPRRDVYRYVTVDRLTQATWTEQGDTFVITGESDHLRDVIGAEDITVRLTVKAKEGCANC